MKSLVTYAIAAETGHPTSKLLLVVIAKSLSGANSGALSLSKLCSLCSAHRSAIELCLQSLKELGFIAFRTETTEEDELVIVDVTNWKFTLPGAPRGPLH